MTYSRQAWTAVIPLRAGSKGLPGKNMRELAGKPLYRHAVDVALEAGASRVILSTDIPEILSADLPPGVHTLSRPEPLCGDDVPMAPVFLHALQATKTEGTVVLLQATSPLRQVEDISAALALFESDQFDLVMTVTEADRGVLKWGRTDGKRFIPLSDPVHCFSNRQSLPPVVRPNGAVYVTRAEWFLAHESFVSDSMGCVQMSSERSLDIDTMADFERCEAALTGHLSDQKGSER